MSSADGLVDTSPEPVDIVVITYNRLLYLEDCIESILTNTVYPYGKLIVVDNNSKDGTREWLLKQEEAGNLVTVFLDKNVGRVRGLEAGMAVSGSEIIAISDDDVWYNSGWLTTCMRILELWPEVAVTSADHRRTVHYVKTEKRGGIKVDFRTSLRTFHLVFRRTALKEAGGMVMSRGRWLGSGFPFGRLHEIGWHSAKYTVLSEEGQENIDQLIRPYTEIGNAEAENICYVEHMAHPTHPKSHIKFYEQSGYAEFHYRAKRGMGNIEFMPARVKKGGA